MRTLICLALALIPNVALALSCLAPNPGREWNGIRQVGQIRHVVVGTLFRDDAPVKGISDLARKLKFDPRISRNFRLLGYRILGNGAKAPYSARIRYEARCWYRSCGPGLRPGSSGLFMVRPRGKARPLVWSGPCGGGYYARIDDRAIEALQACVAAGRCGLAELKALGMYR